MKVIIITDDGKQHEAEIPEELRCHSDISSALKNQINPAEALIDLAGAGSSALRGNKIKIEGNESLLKILLCD